MILRKPLLSLFVVLLVAATCQNDPEHGPRLKFYTMNSAVLPLTVFIDGDSAGVLVKTAILTQVLSPGDTVPAWGSEGTLSIEVTAGHHSIEAKKYYLLSGGDTSTTYSDNLGDGFYTAWSLWKKEIDVEPGLEYPIQFSSSHVSFLPAQPCTVF